MSVLIKGMEMPKDGHEFVLITHDGKAEKLVTESLKSLAVSKAIELPPHGDLIDRDKYELVSYTGTEGRPDTFDDGVMFMLDRLDDAPTIIEREDK